MPVDPRVLELWFWVVTDEVTGRRRQTSYRMTEADARARHGDDAMKVEGSLEVRTPSGATSDFLQVRAGAAWPF